MTRQISERIDNRINGLFGHLLKDYDREPRIVKTRKYRQGKLNEYRECARNCMTNKRHGGAE